MEAVRILTVFNDYLEAGGEAEAVRRVGDGLSGDPRFEVRDVIFQSSSWTGAGAPSVCRQAAWMIRNPRSLSTLRAVHESFRPDLWLLHNIMPVGSAWIHEMARSLGVPLVQYAHNFRPFSVNGYLWAGHGLALGGLRKNYWAEILHGAWQGSRVKTAYYAAILMAWHAMGYYRDVRGWIAVSGFLREKLIEGGMDAGRVHAVPHWWTPMANPPADEDGGYYLFLGRLAEAKGVETLLEAWRRIAKSGGPRAPHLVIAGDGPLRGSVEAAVHEGVGIEYAGVVSGIRKATLLGACSGLIVPSLWWEPLGLTVYEAYDYGKMVFAARSGGLVETVQDGTTGILHIPGCASELARQVLEYHARPEARERMGKAGRIFLHDFGQRKRWQDRMSEIFAAVSGGRRIEDRDPRADH
jgi:glycosyltransferase involved in cell wall biosynthesis